jgi:hypothetical protein
MRSGVNHTVSAGQVHELAGGIPRQFSVAGRSRPQVHGRIRSPVRDLNQRQTHEVEPGTTE